MNNISFKGNFVNNAYVKKWQGHSYIPQKVSFVELDLKNQYDLEALKKITSNWRGIFNEIIYNSALNSSILAEKDHKRFFALTMQEDYFELMNDKKILGLVEFDRLKDANMIEFLQIDPKYIQKRKKNNFIKQIFSSKKFHNIQNLVMYKNIGSAIIDSLKNISDKSIELVAIPGTEKFYKKNGFKLKSFFKPNYFIWKKL